MYPNIHDSLCGSFTWLHCELSGATCKINYFGHGGYFGQTGYIDIMMDIKAS